MGVNMKKRIQTELITMEEGSQAGIEVVLVSVLNADKVTAYDKETNTAYLQVTKESARQLANELLALAEGV
jgi:hypothetical protein